MKIKFLFLSCLMALFSSFGCAQNPAIPVGNVLSVSVKPSQIIYVTELVNGKQVWRSFTVQGFKDYLALGNTGIDTSLFLRKGDTAIFARDADVQAVLNILPQYLTRGQYLVDTPFFARKSALILLQNSLNNYLLKSQYVGDTVVFARDADLVAYLSKAQYVGDTVAFARDVDLLNYLTKSKYVIDSVKFALNKYSLYLPTKDISFGGGSTYDGNSGVGLFKDTTYGNGNFDRSFMGMEYENGMQSTVKMEKKVGINYNAGYFSVQPDLVRFFQQNNTNTSSFEVSPSQIQMGTPNVNINITPFGSYLQDLRAIPKGWEYISHYLLGNLNDNSLVTKRHLTNYADSLANLRAKKDSVLINGGNPFTPAFASYNDSKWGYKDYNKYNYGTQSIFDKLSIGFGTDSFDTYGYSKATITNNHWEYERKTKHSDNINKSEFRVQLGNPNANFYNGQNVHWYSYNTWVHANNWRITNYVNIYSGRDSLYINNGAGLRFYYEHPVLSKRRTHNLQFWNSNTTDPQGGSVGSMYFMSDTSNTKGFAKMQRYPDTNPSISINDGLRDLAFDEDIPKVFTQSIQVPLQILTGVKNTLWYRPYDNQKWAVDENGETTVNGSPYVINNQLTTLKNPNEWRIAIDIGGVLYLESKGANQLNLALFDAKIKTFMVDSLSPYYAANPTKDVRLMIEQCLKSIAKYYDSGYTEITEFTPSVFQSVILSWETQYPTLFQPGGEFYGVAGRKMVANVLRVQAESMMVHRVKSGVIEAFNSFGVAKIQLYFNDIINDYS